jgi:alpha-mannosidase
MKKPYEMHVISNTHWDREWSCNFQETRMQLLDFIDGLIKTLDEEPRYRAFHMDSQAIPVEDYLEVRPENRERIAAHVRSGCLLIGPWYTCPEEFSVNGESLVRNLLYGHRVAQALGGVMKVGYSPFSYGQTSQMPQIYKGFGIDSILFYHGVTHDEVSNEFLLEGPDGTRIFASQMSSQARYNFYHGVYRKVVRNAQVDDRIYHWGMGGLPFHLCTEDDHQAHHVLLDPVSHFRKELIPAAIQELHERERATATTRHLAFMMGHDASVPDPAVLRIIDEAQAHLGKDRIYHSTLPDLVNNVMKVAKNLPVLKGERRTPKVRTGRVHLYSDVLSSRTRMKRLNAQAESILQRWAEPFACVASMLGHGYPAGLLDLAWKTLLSCHAHDSIAGSGVDDIERDMTYRLRQVVNIARGVNLRSLGEIQRRIDHSDAQVGDVFFTVFNSSPYTRSEILTAVVDAPCGAVSREFNLLASDGKTRVPVQIASRKPHHAVVTQPGDAAHTMKCEQIAFHFDARNVPALGYTSFRLNGDGRFERGDLVCGERTMENEHLQVDINDNGTLRVTHKATGTVFDGLHYFQDSGEAGQAWMHVEPAIDKVVTSHGFPVSIALEQRGPLLARFRIEYAMCIPVGLDNAGSNAWERIDGFDNAARRTEVMCELKVASIVTLRKESRCVEVKTSFENTAEMHRLRVMFPTSLTKAKTCHAESAFDVVERPIEPGPDSPWHGIGPRTFPMQRFVDVSDGRAGLAILNEGLREYEVTRDAERTIAVTLLRAFEVSICTSAAGWEVFPEMKLSQCPGHHEFCYHIYPHAGRWHEAEVTREAERLTAPLTPAQAGPHRGDLPKQMSFMEVSPANLAMSALKRSEDGESLVLRLYNPTEKRVDGTVTCFRPIRSAELVTLEEKPLRKLDAKGSFVRLRVDSRKIVSLRLSLG